MYGPPLLTGNSYHVSARSVRVSVRVSARVPFGFPADIPSDPFLAPPIGERHRGLALQSLRLASQPDLRVILVRRPDMAQSVQRGGEEFEEPLQAHEVFDDADGVKLQLVHAFGELRSKKAFVVEHAERQFWLKRQLRAKVRVGLPAYSPNDNPIERVWWHLHEEITRNHRCAEIGEPVELTFAWLDERGPFKIEGSMYERLRAAA